MFRITEHGRFGKKPKGIRRKVVTDKKRVPKLYTIIAFLVVISLVISVSYYLVNYVFVPNSSTNGNGGGTVDGSLKAALVDALYATLPNEGFTGSLTETLEEAGFEVDVFQGAGVTVDFLKSMAGGYNLVILRMHSALDNDGELFLFTAEPYSVGKYIDEQYFRLVKEAYATDDSQSVFAVNWGFIKRGMTGKFNGTLVIAMGCDGTGDQRIIDEFMNQGAVGYISWNGPVLLYHSDAATLDLVEGLYLEELSVEDAIDGTNSQVGADPTWGSILEYYTP